eukprot:TRINITY_DN1411_c0_g1_i1.p2 TRINITY_DN1411_c0_g1~~TRINITY_DN1411_c0_g1_i1.p2  ORF type:complete len:111 (-),score=22.49 TRINITY_DN1411_c0_g1_i1:211-543(-)
MSSLWLKVGGISGFLSVCLGAYGTHGFHPEDDSLKDAWKTANAFHLAHSAALLASPLMNRPNIFGGLMVGGILAFCGSVYFGCLMENRRFFAPAPLGGFALMGGWLSTLL